MGNELSGLQTRMTDEACADAKDRLCEALDRAVDPIILEFMDEQMVPVERMFLAFIVEAWPNKRGGETKFTVPPLVCWRTTTGQSVSNAETDAFEFGQILQRQLKVAYPDLFAKVLEGLTRTLEPAPEAPEGLQQ
jgi:hypothetical protein